MISAGLQPVFLSLPFAASALPPIMPLLSLLLDDHFLLMSPLCLMPRSIYCRLITMLKSAHLATEHARRRDAHMSSDAPFD